jgi:hypothetical protein
MLVHVNRVAIKDLIPPGILETVQANTTYFVYVLVLLHAD